jgi:hypothetical protein
MTTTSLLTGETTAEATAGTTAAPPDRAPAASRWRRHGPHAAVAALYVLLGLVVMANFLPDPRGVGSAHLADDNTWFQWLLSHGAYSVRHLENPLFSVRQNHPDGVNMMANTSVLGVTLPLAPVTMLLGPRVTYVLWIVGACAGTAFVTYLVLRRHVVRSRTAAVIGGAFAGFAPGVVHHANGQPNFVSNFLLPVIVLRVVRLGRQGRWLRDGVILGLLVTYQLFVNEETLLVTATGCAVLVAAAAVLHREQARRCAPNFGRALLVTAGVAGVLCAYPLWFQFHGPGTFRGMPTFHVWGEDPAAYLTWPRDTLAGDAAPEKGIGRTEQNSWFGWPLTVLLVALAVLLWRRSVAARVAVVVAGVAGVLALGPELRLGGVHTGIPGPWAFVPDDLPVLGLLMPSRLTYAVIGAAAVLLAIGWDRLGSAALGRVAFGMALVPLLPTPLPAQADPRPPAFVTSGAWRGYVPAGRTLVPVPVPSNVLGRDGLSWAAWAQHEFAVPEGYFLGPDRAGFGHAGPVELSTLTRLADRTVRSGVAPVVTPSQRAAVLADLRRWNGAAVVVRARPADQPLRSLLEQIAGPPTAVLDVWVWKVPPGATG